MALKERKAGGFVIDSVAAAKAALEMRQELKEGIAEEVAQIEELGQDVARWMKENDVKQIPIEGGHGTLVQRYNPSKWDREKLKALVKKHGGGSKGWMHLWKSLTTREPDPDKIQQAIKDDLISAEAIESAYVEGSAQRPFVQTYKDDD